MFLKRFGPYFSYLKPVRLQFAIGIAAGLLYAGASGAGLPFVIEYLVPLLADESGPRGMKLIGMLLVVPLIFLFRGLGAYFNAYFIAFAGMHVLEQIRAKVFDKLQNLPLAFFQKNNDGDLLSRVTTDTLQLQNAIVKVVDSLFKEPATLLAAGGYLVYTAFNHSNIMPLLIALASVPACVLPIRFIGKRVLAKAGRAQSEAGQISHVLNENLSAVREVRAYGLEKSESTRFSVACRAFLKQSLKVVKYEKALTPILEIVTAFALLSVIFIAIEQSVDKAALAAIVTALYMCYQPAKKLGTVSNTISKAEASLDRLEHILQSEDTVPENPQPTPLGNIKGHISFQGVSFAYAPADTPALSEINIEIAAGEAIALVGPSGAGKTSFANLVPRFYDTTAGTLLIDGKDVRDVLKSELRSRIALVSQEALLFSDSIANNIRIGKPDATLEEIQAASKMAHADDFIQALDLGYETEVGERGSRLSGGQRQRISIARAFLKDAPIIILDEPTSALDAESEHQIQAALEELSKGRTVLIIAHRFSTIQHADRILVFDAGRIVASGTHVELYASNPLYTSLYDKQAKTVHTAFE
jgi:subfamily B ATP-binding cassette protein MsbA